jgi:hypothetical protein
MAFILLAKNHGTERRQDPFAAGGPPPTKLKAFKIEEIAPRTKIQGARRMRLVYGPYKIQAANVRIHRKGSISILMFSHHRTRDKLAITSPWTRAELVT